MKKFFQQLLQWELWNFYIIYAPLGFVWLFYAIKARAFWFFSPVNPTLEFSGFEGEGKKEMYDQLPSASYPSTYFIAASQSFKTVSRAVNALGFAYPFVVKPEIGMQGLMFRVIDSEEAFRQYHNYMPYDYMVQQLVDAPLEFSVFHIRYPGSKKGQITGFIQKDYLSVTGNGTDTLHELIKQHPRAKYREAEMLLKHASNINDIIPAQAKYLLSIAGNHNRGTKFINCKNEIDDQLLEVFDNISLYAGCFYYGRYDIKCNSMKDLKAGNLMILEFNGAGAEPNHIYDCGMRYTDALKEIILHWRHLYRIGKINRQKGIAYWSFKRGHIYLKNAKKYFTKLADCDNHFELNMQATGSEVIFA